MPSPTVSPLRREYDARVVAVTDRLFVEYEHRPIIDVIRAVTGARRELRETGIVPVSPEALADRARALLGPV